MKIWLGKEEEGKEKGAITLFVKARVITRVKAIVIYNLYTKHRPEYIYLGAGEKDVLFISRNAFAELPGKIKIETSRLTGWIYAFNFYQIIIRKKCKKIGNILPKIRDSKNARIFYGFFENSIEDVKNGLYKDDITVWDE